MKLNKTLMAKSIAILLWPMLSMAQQSPLKPLTSAQLAKSASTNYGKLPLTFEANKGQTDPSVKFFSRGSGYSVFLTSQGMVLALRPSGPTQTVQVSAASVNDRAVQSSSQPASGSAVLVNLVGAAKNPQVVGEDLQPGKVNYFTGKNPKKWQTNVPTYGRVRYKNVYPGIDLVYYGNHRQVEYDFVASPGANPNKINLEVKGADNLQLDAGGNLILQKGAQEVHFQTPKIYQEAQGSRVPIEGGYTVNDKTHVGFNLKHYDKTKPLVIDPVLVYSTYLGGFGQDEATAIAVDSAGNAYVTGTSSSTNFPLAGSSSSLSAGEPHIFVAKLDISGSNLLYVDFLGGSCQDYANSLALDASKNVYVTGYTCSSDFPTQNAYQDSISSFAAFVTKISPDGASLVYSTYLSGSNYTQGNAIAVDSANEAYVGGTTYATDFPTTAGASQNTVAPNQDGDLGNYGFVTKFSADGGSLIYSTYLAGSSNQLQPCFPGGPPTCQMPAPNTAVSGIAVDTNGNAYVAGSTNTYDFPTTSNAYQTTDSVPYDQAVGFVSQFTSSGALNVSSYFSGSAVQGASLNGIAIDLDGSAYITGTSVSDGTFPLTPGSICDPNVYHSACGTAFVVKFDPAISNLSYSTFLGANNSASPTAIALDSSNDAYVFASSSNGQFSLINGIENYSNESDAILVEIDPTGSSELLATYLGGSGNDTSGGLAVDPNGNIYLSGYTDSTDLPITQSAFQTTQAGGIDAFVAKVSQASAPAVALSPSILQYTISQVGSQSQPATALLRNMGTAALSISSVTTTGDFAQTNTCGTSVSAASSCTFSVTFSPTAAGPRYGSVLIQDDAAGSPHFISLVGEGSTAVVNLNPGTLSFGSLPVGTSSSPQTITLKNSGNATLDLTNIQISTGYTQTNNCPAQLPFGSSCQFQITFTPGTGGVVNGALTLSDNVLNSPQTIALSGSGYVTTATFSPLSLSFGSIQVGSSSSAKLILVTNTGANAMTVSGVSTVGDFAKSTTCTTLAANGGTCTISVTFAPTASGIRSGSLIINDNAQGNPHTIALAGVGTSGLASISPSSLTFSSASVGTTSAAQIVTVTNTGTGILTFSTIQTAGAFSQTNNCTTVAPASSCSISVKFTPTTSGANTGSITLTDSDASSPQTVSLTGTGVDFSVASVGSSSATTTAGSSATYKVAITPVGGSFSTAIGLICSGAPALATCTVNPTSVTPQAGAPNVTVTITTTATVADARPSTQQQQPLFAVLLTVFQGAGVFGIVLSKKRSRKHSWCVLLGILLLTALLLTGCAIGSGSAPKSSTQPGTPAGNYTVLVIGSSGSVQHFTSLTLTVQ